MIWYCEHSEVGWRIYASTNWVRIDSGNGMSPDRRQGIAHTITKLVSIRSLETKLSEILFKFAVKKTHLKCHLPFLGAQCLNTSRPSDAYIGVCEPAWWRHEMETFSALLFICVGNSPVPGNSPHKGQLRGAFMFSLICVGINGWVNNRKDGDLRRHRAYYDVIVMGSVMLELASSYHLPHVWREVIIWTNGDIL